MLLPYSVVAPFAAAALDRYLASARETYRLAVDRFLYTSFDSGGSLLNADVLRNGPRLSSLLTRSLESHIATRFDELFLYPEKVKTEEREDSVLLVDDEVRLGPVVRDALAMEADERPLCREDCPGLCAQCGFRMEDDPDHHHEVIDERFAALKGLFDEDPKDDDAQNGKA